MTIRARDNGSEPELVYKLTEQMEDDGWDLDDIIFHPDLKVWISSGSWRGQKREGRGSTQLLALEALNTLTPR